MEPSEITLPAYLRNCARCKGDHKERIEWKQLTYPMNEYTHWAMCPTNGEPILMRIVEIPDPIS
jgi:hypothetical protein